MSTAAAISAIIGPEAWETLVAWHGGRRLHIPRSEAYLGPLIGAIGERAALRLLEEAPGCHFDIPRGQWARPVSTIRVQRMAEKGMKVREIARELRCTERTVYKQLARARAG